MDRRRARPGATTRTVVQAATPAVTVPADLPVQAAERRFRLDPDLRGLVVRDVTGSVHLLARAHLDGVLAGPFGYGRALHSRRTVSDILPGDTLLLPGDMTLRAAAEAVLRRVPSSRYDDVVVAGPADGFGLLGPPAPYAVPARGLSAAEVRASTR